MAKQRTPKIPSVSSGRPGDRHDARLDGLCVAGLGHAFRGDDGAGPRVVAALARRLPEAANCLRHIADPIDLVEHWRGCRLAIVVDATRGAGKPGTISQFDSADGPLPTAPEAFTSTHGFGLAQAIAMARALSSLPGRLLIFGIEGHNFEAGAALSPVVARALDQATERIAAIIETYRQGPGRSARGEAGRHA